MIKQMAPFFRPAHDLFLYIFTSVILAAVFLLCRDIVEAVQIKVSAAFVVVSCATE